MYRENDGDRQEWTVGADGIPELGLKPGDYLLRIVGLPGAAICRCLSDAEALRILAGYPGRLIEKPRAVPSPRLQVVR